MAVLLGGIEVKSKFRDRSYNVMHREHDLTEERPALDSLLFSSRRSRAKEIAHFPASDVGHDAEDSGEKLSATSTPTGRGRCVSR